MITLDINGLNSPIRRHKQIELENRIHPSSASKNSEKRKQINKMVKINTNLSMLILNINGLSSPIKRHELADRIRKQNPSFCCLPETYFIINDRYQPHWGARTGNDTLRK